MEKITTFAKVGNTVRYNGKLNINLSSDPEKFLKYGWYYKVKRVEMHDSYCNYVLEEVPNEKFSSLNFNIM